MTACHAPYDAPISAGSSSISATAAGPALRSYQTPMTAAIQPRLAARPAGNEHASSAAQADIPAEA